MRIAIIGAGAAGCFAAINIKRKIADAEITVFESGRKPLAKVAVTGGGRCNLTIVRTCEEHAGRISERTQADGEALPYIRPQRRLPVV